MAYREFLVEFAHAHNIPSADVLLSEHSGRFSFQINSRERAKAAIAEITSRVNVDTNGLRVLDIGCAFGSFCVEFANRGAFVVGLDVSDKWLKLAQINAQDEADCVFYNLDASTRRARAELAPHGPFDLIVINDVFEHVFDTVGLLDNIRSLIAPGGHVYYKVPNGHAVRSVISEGHKKVYGISLLAPDYWGHFVKTPFQIYYRRETYFRTLFEAHGLSLAHDLTPVTDPSIERTRAAIKGDLSKVKKLLQKENFKDPTQFKYIRNGVKNYIYEVEEDLNGLEWRELFRKYRATFWTGILQSAS